MKRTFLAAIATIIAIPAFAGDAAIGEKEFKKCKSCHEIVADDGTEIQKGGKTGPNLYKIIGKQIASQAGFGYGADLQAYGATGAVWTEESIAVYMNDPKAWLGEVTGNAGAKSKMSFKMKKNQADVAAYLASIGQ